MSVVGGKHLRGFMKRSVIGAVLLASVFFVAGNREANAAACTYGSCAPSGTIINNVVTLNSSTLLANILSDHISQIVGGVAGLDSGTSKSVFALGQGDGKAAGSSPTPWGVWGSIANNWIQDTQMGASFKGGVFDGMGGADYSFANGALLGLSAGYEHIGLHTGFNNGGLHSDGFALAPYAALRLTPILSIDGEFGHTWVDYHEGHGGISGSYNGDRWFGTTNLNAKTAVDNWQLGSSLGLFYVSESQSAYTESNANPVANSTPYVGEVQLKGSLGYDFNMQWGRLTPYVSARLEFDPLQSSAAVINAQNQTVSQSNFGVTFGSGVNMAIGDRVTVDVTGTTSQFRRYFSDYGLTGTVRVAF